MNPRLQFSSSGCQNVGFLWVPHHDLHSKKNEGNMGGKGRNDPVEAYIFRGHTRCWFVEVP